VGTVGTDDKRPGARLSQVIEKYQENFLAASERDLWGHPARIWPSGGEWFAAIKRRANVLESLRSEIAMADLGDKQLARWELFFQEAAGWSPGVPMGNGLGYLLGNALKNWPELEVITVERKKQELTPSASNALRGVIQSIIGAELARRVGMTQGL